EDEPFEMTVTASDPDLKWGLDSLTFSDDSLLFDIDPLTGRISFTPGNEHVGRHQITITVTDGSGASDRASFYLTVLNVNDPPRNVRILSPTAGEKIKEGMKIWLNGSAEDIDASDVLTFKWLDNGEPLGEGRSISVMLRPGRHTISLEVSDGTDRATAEVTVTVERAGIAAADHGWVMWTVLVAILALALLAVLSLVRHLKRG
ncbi:MAG: putative Ig domain-containing protein, partial [Thermoplasmata archaeon]